MSNYYIATSDKLLVNIFLNSNAGVTIHTLDNNTTHCCSAMKVYKMIFSPDNNKLICHCLNVQNWQQNQTNIWDLREGRLLFTLKDQIRWITFTTDSLQIVTSNFDNILKFWDASNGNLVRTVAFEYPASDTLQYETFSHIPESVKITSTINDAELKFLFTKICDRVRNIQSNRLLCTEFLLFDNNCKMIVSYGQSKRQFEIFDLQGNFNCIFTEQKKYDMMFAVESDNCCKKEENCHLIATASRKKSINIWETKISANKKFEASIKLTLTGHSADLMFVKFSSDNRQIISTSYDNTIKIWDLETGLLKTNIDLTPKTLSTVAISTVFSS